MKIRGLLGTEALFAFGGDSAPKDPPRVGDVPPARVEEVESLSDEEIDEGDDDVYEDKAAGRRIRKLSRENTRRRIENKAQKKNLENKDEEIAALRAELEKAKKLQVSYDSLKNSSEQQMETVRRMAIRSAIERDAVQNEKGEASPRVWYDVNMVEGQLDKSKLSVDLNDFSVGGLQEQLDAIAEKSPFLVKGSENQSSNGRQPNSYQPSGQTPQSSATGSGTENQVTEENKMLADFPALQNTF